MAVVSVQLVVHNGAKYIPYLFDSLKLQSFQDYEVIIVDNASTDTTLNVLMEQLHGTDIKYRVIRNSENRGFALGHNQAYRESKAPYVFLQNVDICLMPNVLEDLLEFLEEHLNVAAVAPRLMCWDFERTAFASASGQSLGEAAKVGRTTMIDSLGLLIFKSRYVEDRGHGEEWTDNICPSPRIAKCNMHQCQEVFGVSGALPMFRRIHLESVLLPGGYLFDPTYHSYKEDVDLAYRVRNSGFSAFVLYDVVAYHDRTAKAAKKSGLFSMLKQKRGQSLFILRHSYTNHLRTLYKNESWQNFLYDGIPILWHECKKFLFFLLIHPSVLFFASRDFIVHFRSTAEARRCIQKQRRRVSWKEIRRWFN